MASLHLASLRRRASLRVLQSPLRCALVAILPPDLTDALAPIAVLLSAILDEALVILLPVMQIGLLIPGDVILAAFGWATVDKSRDVITDGLFDTDTLGWYVAFALSMALIIIELGKILASVFISWVRR